MGILDLVFPRTCLGCGRGGKYLCQVCIDQTSRSEAICPYCKHSSIDGATHINCQRELGIDGLTSIWGYGNIISKAILSLKYKYATQIGDELSDYIISSLKKIVLPGVLYLTPIPIHWHRQNIRGFNQSIEIGRAVSEAMNWKFISDLLIKKQSTISQVELGGVARRQNLKDAFVINQNYIYKIPESIILFDDVFTTGSTLLEATKVLKRAGVRKVWGLTIAR